jgi:hypothetical protein
MQEPCHSTLCNNHAYISTVLRIILIINEGDFDSHSQLADYDYDNHSQLD